MADSSDEQFDSADDSDHRFSIYYKDNPEWSDVIPIPQDDGPRPVVQIAYSAKFKDAYDYFRAILKSGEKSERVLALTEDCAWLNPANYTVWQYRRETLEALDKDLKAELKFIGKMIKCHTKNYQVWHHRKAIVEGLQDPSEELKFTEMILQEDEKNYHAWQYRQWCIKTFNLYDNELTYVARLLEEDVRNNSAWNQRYFVISNTTTFTPNIIQREIDFTLDKIVLVPGNESAWNYLRGILMHDKNGLAFNDKVRNNCETLYNQGCRTNHLLACIIDICQENRVNETPTDSLFHVNNAITLCKELAEKYDVIRKKYWQYIEQQITLKLQSEVQ